MEAHASNWTFFSNYGHIMLILSQDPEARLRDIAERVGITERAVHRLISEMEHAGVLSRERQGRRTHYTIARDYRLRHPIENHRTIGDLIRMIWPEPDTAEDSSQENRESRT